MIKHTRFVICLWIDSSTVYGQNMQNMVFNSSMSWVVVQVVQYIIIAFHFWNCSSHWFNWATNKVLYQIASHDTCLVQQDSHERILHCPFLIVLLEFTIYHKKQPEWNEWTPVTCYVLASYVAQQSLKIRFPLASMVLKGSLKEVSSPPEKNIITKNFRYLEMEDTKIPFTLFFGYFFVWEENRRVFRFSWKHKPPYP